ASIENAHPMPQASQATCHSTRRKSCSSMRLLASYASAEPEDEEMEVEPVAKADAEDEDWTPADADEEEAKVESDDDADIDEGDAGSDQYVHDEEFVDASQQSDDAMSDADNG